MSIDMMDMKDNNSPIKLIEPGTLRFDSINNIKMLRIIKSNINIESIYREWVLLIIKPVNRNSDIDEKLCDKEMMIPLNKQHELNDKHETKTKFKCNIDEKAIIFFKSKYLKQEHVITNKPNNVKVNKKEVRNCNDR